MMIKKSLSCILGLMLAVFFVTSTAKAAIIPVVAGDPAVGISAGDTAVSSLLGVVAESIPFSANVFFEHIYLFEALTSQIATATVEITAPNGTNPQAQILFEIFVRAADLLFVPADLVFSSPVADEALGLDPVSSSGFLALGDFVKIVISGTSLGTGTYDLTVVSSVPIPAAGILFGSVFAGIGFISRRRRRKTQNSQAII